MKTRILVAIPITLLVLLAVFIQGWILAAFALVLALFAQFEVMHAFDRTDHRVVKSVSGTFAVLLALMFLADFFQSPATSMAWLSPSAVLMLFVFCVMATFVVAMFQKKQSFDGAAVTVFTLAYPQLFMACFYYMILCAKRSSGQPEGSTDLLAWTSTMLAMLMLFIPPMLSDTTAYFWGRQFGRTKLAPVISPKKTVAGSVAGVAGGGVAGLLVFWLVPIFARMRSVACTLSASWGAYVIMGCVLAALSQVGDLAASFLKRSCGIKDFGKLLPGHGGVMDRIDSTMFVMPIVCVLVTSDLIGVQF